MRQAAKPNATGTAPQPSRFGQGLGWVYYRFWTAPAEPGAQGLELDSLHDWGNWHTIGAQGVAVLSLPQMIRTRGLASLAAAGGASSRP